MSQATLRIGALHMRVRLGSRRINLKRLQLLLADVYRKSRGEVDVIILPSHPFTGPVIGGYYSPEKIASHLRSFAERIQSAWGSLGFTINTLSKLAADYNVNIIAGPIIERAGPRLYLSTIHVGSNGELLGRYRKITVTEEERRHSIGPGREIGVFNIEGRGRIGVFADADLVNPEIFRGLQVRGVNIIVGSLLPQRGEPLLFEAPGDRMLRPKTNIINSLIVARAVETGLPIVLVGGIVEASEGSIIAYSDTLIADPDIGIIESYTRSVDDPDSYVLVEVDVSKSRPRLCDDTCRRMIRMFCTTFKSAKSK
ncbi:MAG: carbon-nitrogen hydrolase family protein [Desulfurococcales archaeon]|nr:carbon-nitrogen hydrolase family protein [Desulfurococcales archaeon]